MDRTTKPPRPRPLQAWSPDSGQEITAEQKEMARKAMREFMAQEGLRAKPPDEK